MTTYEVFGRSFETIDAAIEYGQRVDAFEIAIVYNGQIVSKHEIEY